VISVLTVNYQSSVDLAVLAESLHVQDCGEEIELIVTNNSSDDPVAIAGDARLKIRVIDSKNDGFAAGINKAFRESRGGTIMIANPDVQLLPGTLAAAMIEIISHPEAGVILPLLRHPDGRMQSSARRFYSWPVVLYARSFLRNTRYKPRFFRDYLCENLDEKKTVDVDWGLGAAMFLRRHEIPADRIFDERFFLYFEDVDLCFRTWQSGRSVLFCPQIECIHAHRRASRNALSSAGLQHFRSLLKFVWKYGGLQKRPGVLRSPASIQ
jgi:N-acetylglucosaminyl-diphospho-decaprenol L-rhamnosyltransferase